MGGLIPPELWAEMLEKHQEDGLNPAQISRLLERKHNIFITRQAVWSRLDRCRYLRARK